MAFSSWAEFLAMGGHGLYVWLAYGSSLLITLLLLVMPIIKHRQMKQNIRIRKQLADQQQA